jgi:hypothetical protein
MGFELVEAGDGLAVVVVVRHVIAVTRAVFGGVVDERRALGGGEGQVALDDELGPQRLEFRDHAVDHRRQRGAGGVAS